MFQNWNLFWLLVKSFNWFDTIFFFFFCTYVIRFSIVFYGAWKHFCSMASIEGQCLVDSITWSHCPLLANGHMTWMDLFNFKHRSLYVVSRYRYFMKDIDTQSIPELIDSPITAESGDCDWSANVGVAKGEVSRRWNMERDITSDFYLFIYFYFYIFSLLRCWWGKFYAGSRAYGISKPRQFKHGVLR